VSAARPATSTAVVFHAPNDLRLEEFPLPAPGPGEVVLRVTACGLCPGEVMDWYQARKAPVPLGHETVGVVADAGTGARYAPGTRLFVHHHAPCLTCRACRRGDHVHCAAWAARRLIPGGLATYALAQAAAVAADALPVPETVSDEAATFIEPLACVVKALRRARLRGGDRVLVVGCGVMGLLHLMALRARPEPELLLAADRVPARVAAAVPLADRALDVSSAPLADAVREATGGGADVAIVGPGSLEALEAALAALAPGGTLLMFTPTPPEVRWPLRTHDLFFREIAVVPSYSAGPDDTREALRLIAAGLPVASLVTHRLPLREAAAGYAVVRAAAEGRARGLKVIVTP
jgi:L-iditol 2-dehydrogenase